MNSHACGIVPVPAALGGEWKKSRKTFQVALPRVEKELKVFFEQEDVSYGFGFVTRFLTIRGERA